MPRGIVALVFRCHTISGTLIETDESRDFRWVTADEVSFLASEAFAIRILDAMRTDGGAMIRQHDGRPPDRFRVISTCPGRPQSALNCEYHMDYEGHPNFRNVPPGPNFSYLRY